MGKEEGIRLNKFLAHAGVCSRREADTFITAGVVKINGKVVTQLGTKVMPSDKVEFEGRVLRREQLEYYVLNKPRDYISTVKDTHDRKTVMHLMEKASRVRLYPVGRLDRMTSGLLLFTNDGDLAKKLTHPKYEVEKIYKVTLDQPVKGADLKQLVQGIKLDDGPAVADEASYVEGERKNVIGLRLHSGRNRVVRRMFEALGYKVVKLDRTVFAGITKKNLSRGQYRALTSKEVHQLKSI